MIFYVLVFIEKNLIMNKSQRIYLSSGDTGNSEQDKYIKVKLEQDVDTIEFMSLSIGTSDVYQNFNSDYGILVGRVLANNSIGIPNVRISIFIALTDEDAENAEIYSIYPYKTPRDKNNEGKRYNLLPRVAQTDPKTGIVTPKQPFGSFPIKEEIVGNDSLLEVYKKYYKYTALTNNNGDYMIFGLPTGAQTVHMSVDITDIGEYSMNAAAMVTNLGYSQNLFTDDGNKIKPSNDLGDLPNIETQEITVDVRPFWGDVENFEIGITRQDFRIRSTLKNTFTIFGSVFTDGYKMGWGEQGRYVKRQYQFNGNGVSADPTGIQHKRSGKVTEKIYYYPANITDAQIATGNFVSDMLLLDSTEYSVYKQNGDFVLILNCNRDKVTINEDGTQTPVDNSYAGGLYTTFRGFMTLEIEDDTLPLDWNHEINGIQTKPIRQILKFPQTAYSNIDTYKFDSFRAEENEASINATNAWREQHYQFCGGCIYSVSRFHPVVFNSTDDGKTENGCICGDAVNNAKCASGNNVGNIQTNDYAATGNTYYEFPANSVTSEGRQIFGANWMNISIYLPQTHWVYNNYSYICNKCNTRTNSQFQYRTNSTYYTNDNQQLIAGSYTNTCSFARSDYNWTDFIEVPKEDIISLDSYGFKGGKTNTTGTKLPNNCVLTGKYRNGYNTPTGNVVTWSTPSPSGGGRSLGDCTCSVCDKRVYFYKGYNSSDVIGYIRDLGLI